jgi:hypothetical protein
MEGFALPGADDFGVEGFALPGADDFVFGVGDNERFYFF